MLDVAVLVRVVGEVSDTGDFRKIRINLENYKIKAPPNKIWIVQVGELK